MRFYYIEHFEIKEKRKILFDKCEIKRTWLEF